VSPRLRTAPLREEHRLRVCGNKLLRHRKEVRGDWRQFYTVMLCNFFDFSGLMAYVEARRDIQVEE